MMKNTQKILLAGSAALAFGMVANTAAAQVGTITPGATVIGANNGTNTCIDGTRTGGYTVEHAEADGVHGDSQPLPAGPDYTDSTVCTSYDASTSYSVSSGPSTSLGSVPGTSHNDLIVVSESGTASADGSASQEITYHTDVTDASAPVLVGTSGPVVAPYGDFTTTAYEYTNTTETLQNSLYSATTTVSGTGNTGTGSQTENLVTAGAIRFSQTTGTSTFDPDTGDVTYTATAGKTMNLDVNGLTVTDTAGGTVALTSGGLVVGDGIAASSGQAAIASGVRIDSTTQKITGLANGTIAQNSSDAVTGGQLWAVQGQLDGLTSGLTAINNRVDLLSRRVDKAYQGVAMGFASNAAPLNLANGEGGISAGVGYFQGEWAGAVKAQYVTDAGVGLGVNVGFSSDAVGGGVGASIKF